MSHTSAVAAQPNAPIIDSMSAVPTRRLPIASNPYFHNTDGSYTFVCRRPSTGTREMITIDAQDLHRVLDAGPWIISPQGYACRSIQGKMTTLQHFLVRPRPGYVSDHINRDKSDYRRSNLREVTPLENIQNSDRPVPNNGRRGVNYNHQTGKWCARIYRNGCLESLGTFDTLESALQARREADLRKHADRAARRAA